MLWIIMLLVVLGLAALRQSQQAKRAGAPPEKTWMARIVMWIVAVDTVLPVKCQDRLL
jgi:UPF0716 family protein affecting phage T7 exclusion